MRSPRTTGAPYGIERRAGERRGRRTGSSGAFLLAFLAAFDAGDTVAMARPGYPAYRNMLAALGCTVVELPCGPETRFQPTVAQLDALERAAGRPRSRQPGQPDRHDGAADELAAISRWCDEHGTRLVSDEIYHGITYGSQPRLRLGDEPAQRSSSTPSRSTSR